MRKRILSLRARAAIAAAILLAPSGARATTISKEASLVELVGQSELILRGRVADLTDGFDERGIPYTEVTIQVSETVKGEAGREVKFRQFGLIRPRKAADGRTCLMVTPTGWATYTRGEDAIVFLGKPAAWTGLRTTAGLGLGKFTVRVAGAVNARNNAGLFAGVHVEPALLGESGKRVLSTQKGAVNAKAFLGLVRQAVEGNWIEKGSMRHDR
jgi:hypothetical protein